MFDTLPTIFADNPHFILRQGYTKPICTAVKNHVRNKISSMYKLSYKFHEEVNHDNDEMLDNTNYLLNTIRLL